MDSQTKKILEAIHTLELTMTEKFKAAEVKLAEFRTYTESEFQAIREELKDIRTRLDALEEKVSIHSGFAKEIDHALSRISAIEKHLGIKPATA